MFFFSEMRKTKTTRDEVFDIKDIRETVFEYLPLTHETYQSFSYFVSNEYIQRRFKPLSKSDMECIVTRGFITDEDLSHDLNNTINFYRTMITHFGSSRCMRLITERVLYRGCTGCSRKKRNHSYIVEVDKDCKLNISIHYQQSISLIDSVSTDEAGWYIEWFALTFNETMRQQLEENIQSERGESLVLDPDDMRVIDKELPYQISFELDPKKKTFNRV